LPAGEKSKNQLKNDKKREEKMAKFLAKQDKLAKDSAAAPAKVSSKPKTLSIKTAEVVEDRTIPGEKKGSDLVHCTRGSWSYL
jgi:hypothetical protein